jgi:glycosyltransferase involved in cell wall biosynthesis
MCADNANGPVRSPKPASDMLICVPCYNAEGTILECVGSLLGRPETDLLLVDDHSTTPLKDFLRQHLQDEWSSITVVRPEGKVYAEGGRNLGIDRALQEQRGILVFVDSDIVAPRAFLSEIQAFFHANPDEIVVSATIEPYGGVVQYAETLVNFSRYLRRSHPEVARTRHLASYAFALNLAKFRENPCRFESSHDQQGVWWSAEDIHFFESIKSKFSVADFPIMNRVTVLHKHPRSTLWRAVESQRRYARAMLRSGHQRYWLANAIPLVHLLTPRFWLMLVRLLRRGRFGDLPYLPVCWFLDFCRGVHTVRLIFTVPRAARHVLGDQPE